MPPEQGKKLSARLDSIRRDSSELLATADQGRILREGVRVVIYGATNAGKSSLLNRLLGYDRVIVSETHGTTRDTIEEMINLRGVPIRLLDTDALRISCATGQGLAELKNEILARIATRNLRAESAVAINMRHRDCLRRALE